MRPLLVAALVAAAASTASAGGYLGLGIGTAASPGGELSMTSSDGSRSGRLLGGNRWGRFSVEGEVSRFGLYRDTSDYDGTQLVAAGKYNFPMGDNFEVFGRGGLQRTWLSPNQGTGDWAGNGWLLGAGFEYHPDISGISTAVTAALFVDYQYSSSSLSLQSGPTTERGMTFGLWTLGAIVNL